MTPSAQKAYDTWAKQGRTDEQKWAVMNFLTGAGNNLSMQKLDNMSKYILAVVSILLAFSVVILSEVILSMASLLSSM